MLKGNQLEQAFKGNGVEGKSPKLHKKKTKQFKCFKCGRPMVIVENTNVLVCECGQYFIFDN